MHICTQNTQTLLDRVGMQVNKKMVIEVGVE